MDPARARQPVRDALADVQSRLLDFFEEGVRDAQQSRQVTSELDARQMAFALDGVLVGADLNYLLFRDPGYLELARAEVRRLLEA